MKKTRVYCSGPLFSPEERDVMESIAAVVEKAGHDTFLPHRDGLEQLALKLGKAPGAQSATLGKANTFLRRAIFALDIFQLVDRCDAVVFNMNGRVPDEGAVVESAITFALGRPLVIYKNDERTVFQGFDNPMVYELAPSGAHVSSIDKIPGALKDAIRRSGGRDKDDEAKLPPHLASVVDLGREVWRIWRVAKITPRNMNELSLFLDGLRAVLRRNG